MFFRVNNLKLLQRSIVDLKAASRQNLSTTKSARGGGHDAHHGGGGGGHDAPKRSIFDRLFAEPEDPRYHRGFYYREIGNVQGNTNAAIGRIGVTFAWAWIFYWLYSTPEMFFGHAPYPDTSKWTDQELGIPSDDE